MISFNSEISPCGYILKITQNIASTKKLCENLKKKKTFLDHQKHKNFFRTILLGLLFLVLRFELSVPGIFFKMRLLLLSIRLKASCAEFCFKIRLMLFAVSIWIKFWCWKLFWWDIKKSFQKKKKTTKKLDYSFHNTSFNFQPCTKNQQKARDEQKHSKIWLHSSSSGPKNAWKTGWNWEHMNFQNFSKKAFLHDFFEVFSTKNNFFLEKLKKAFQKFFCGSL